jgi:DNA-binding PadR family transcriptional regulator
MNNTEFEETLSSLLRKGAVRMVWEDGVEYIELTEKGDAALERLHEQ